jgi:hypothetical protein
MSAARDSPAHGPSSDGAVSSAVEPFRIAGYEGVVNKSVLPSLTEAELERLTDPQNASETIHWGRNYLYAVELRTIAGVEPLVVKQFRNQGVVARLKRRWTGSKAEKSWRAAGRLVENGVRTPVPVMLIESIDPEGPSFFVTRRLGDFFESRYYFRALAAGSEAVEFPDIERDDLIGALATACRRIHDAGVWHRDLSIGNLLVFRRDEGLAVSIIDLNRARLDHRMSPWRRTRDLCRLPFPDRGSREMFLSTYWSRPIRAGTPRYGLFWLMQQSFLLRNRLKVAARRPFRALRDLVRGRRPHVHIPAAPAGARARDKIVWDYLSDQPHQHATRAERAGVRMADLGAHVEALRVVTTATPRIWSRYRSLRSSLFEQPVEWNGVGIGLRPRSEDPEGLLETLEDTGVCRVMLRLHPWESGHREERELAAELAGRGYDVAFALPQNRDLVRDLERWSDAVEEIAATFLPFGNHFQIGQAINRSKWGVWTYREYLELAARASLILRSREAENVVIVGPAVIDFEFQAAAAVLNMSRDDVRFDIVSSLLYVDRRGAPENTQLGFDSPMKAALLKAIAETSRNGAGRCWVTEVNWPLWEGPHSPAGRTVAVDEQAQADYLCRYYLLMLASGMIERVYWWRLVARGYGLLEPLSDGGLRRRPSHRALKVLEGELGGGRFESRVQTSADSRLLLFSDRNSCPVAVGWSLADPVRVNLPRPAMTAVDRDGADLRLDDRERVEVTPGPRYFRLES